MAKLRSQISVRRELSQGMKTLRSERGMSLAQVCRGLKAAGVRLSEPRARALENGEYSLVWTEFLLWLRVVECPLSGFGRVLFGELPECHERPPLRWAYPVLCGLALGKSRERAEVPLATLLGRLAGAGMTLEKIERWERGELPITVVRLVMILEVLGLDLGDLERELARQSAQLGLGTGRGRSMREGWGHLLIEPGG